MIVWTVAFQDDLRAGSDMSQSPTSNCISVQSAVTSSKNCFLVSGPDDQSDSAGFVECARRCCHCLRIQQVPFDRQLSQCCQNALESRRSALLVKATAVVFEGGGGLLQLGTVAKGTGR